MAVGGFLGRFFETPAAGKGAVCLAAAQDEDQMEIKGEQFGKIPYAGGPGLRFQPVGSLGASVRGSCVPIWSRDILASIAAGLHSKASSSLPAATDAIKAY